MAKRRIPNGMYGAVRGRRLITASYSMVQYGNCRRLSEGIGPFHLKNVGTAKTTAAPYRAATVFPIPYAAFQYRKDGCPVIVVF